MAHSNRKTIADLVRENEQIAAPASATFKWDKTGKPRFGDAIILHGTSSVFINSPIIATAS